MLCIYINVVLVAAPIHKPVKSQTSKPIKPSILDWKIPLVCIGLSFTLELVLSFQNSVTTICKRLSLILFYLPSSLPISCEIFPSETLIFSTTSLFPIFVNFLYFQTFILSALMLCLIETSSFSLEVSTICASINSGSCTGLYLSLIHIQMCIRDSMVGSC